MIRMWTFVFTLLCWGHITAVIAISDLKNYTPVNTLSMMTETPTETKTPASGTVIQINFVSYEDPSTVAPAKSSSNTVVQVTSSTVVLTPTESTAGALVQLMPSAQGNFTTDAGNTHSNETDRIDILTTYRILVKYEDMKWNESYLDNSTFQYQQLRNETISLMDSTFSNETSYIGSEVLSFRPGSIIADLGITFKEGPGINQDIIKKLLMNATDLLKNISMGTEDGTNTTSVPAVTVHFYIHKDFVVQIANWSWTDDLSNNSSPAYSIFKNQLHLWLTEAFKNYTSYNGTKITYISKKNFTVGLEITFTDPDLTSDQIILALKNSVYFSWNKTDSTTENNNISSVQRNKREISNLTTVESNFSTTMSANQTTESTVNVTESARITTSSLQPLVNVTEIYNLTTVASNISTTMSATNETEAFNMTTTVYIMTGMETNTTATLNMTYSVTNATEAYYTTTPLPTNMTYSTTSIYSTTEMKLKMFSVSFKIISLNWTEELNNQSSEQYKHLTTDVIEKMNETLRKFSSFNQVLITGLSQGSVVVDSKISFYESNISNNDVIEALKNITFWTIDTNSINVTEYFVSSTTLVPTTSITLPMSTNQTTESTVNVTESARTTTSSLQPLVNVTEIYNLTTVASNISTTMSAINETEAFNITTTVYIMTGMERNTTATLNMTYSVTNATEAYYTTTPLPTNMTYSTTSIYSTTEMKLKMFSVSFKIISLNWTEELNNQSSEQYKHLTTDVIEKMNKTLRKFSSFNQVLITGLSQGSVVVDSKISFYESNISNNDVIEALKNITFWTIDTNSINVTEYFVSSTTLVPTTSITLPMSTNQTTESTVNVTESARTTTSSLQPLVNVTEIYNLTTVASNISTTMSAINETEAFNMTTTVYIMTGMETNTTATLNMTYSVTNATEAYYTTTPLPTNMTYSTTSIYSTTELKLKMFSVSFKIISLNWTEELNNQSSEQYKHLTTDVIGKMNETLRKFSSFNQVLITGLSQGSVVVDSKISFYESNISNNDVIEALKNITFWTIDTNSINVTEYFVSSTTLVPTTSITLPMSTNQTTESTVNVTESARTTTSSLQPLVNVTEIYNLTTVASNISTTMSAINETEAFNITTTVYIMTGMETNTTATLNMTYSVTNATEAYYTTTPLPTNMTYSTTSIYSTTEMKLKMFSVSFKIISLNWTEELNNQSSEQYKHLTTDVIEKMNKTLRKFSSFNQVLITGLSQGSVVVDSKISFYESNISNNDVIEALKNITFWTIDTNSINVTEYFVSSTTLVPTTSITLPMSTNQTTESTVNVTESARTTTSSLQPLVNVTEIYNLTTVASNISTTMSAINETEAFNMTTTVYIMTGMETNTTATLNMTYSVTNATEAYYTTTPLPTNMTYSTTSIYSTTEMKLKMFSVSFKIISLNWTEELNNQSSEQYKHLTTDVIEKMNKTLRKFSSFNQVLITGLSQGSVVVDSKISFYESNISNNDVIEALKNITFWTIDTNSINVTEYFVSSTTLVPTTSITLPMSTNQTTESTVNVTESARTTTSSLQPLVNVTEIYNLTTVASNISTTMSAINETEAFNITTTVYIMTGMERNTTATLNMTYSVTNATEAYYTTTPLPTNMTYSTTSIYSTTEMKLKMFSVSFKIISLNWTEELNNQSSEQYKHLTTDVIEKMNKTLRKFSSFNQVLITGLSQGSVVVDSKISFYESNISNNDVIEALKNITFWTIDTNSINVTEYFVSSTTLVPTTSITLPMSTNQTTESTVNVTESARTTTSSLQPLVNVTEIYNLTTVASNISTTMSAINETEAFNITTTVYIMTGMERNTTATLNMTYSVTNATEAYYTTTPLPTNMTYSTTSIYSTTEMKLKMFSVSFKIISLNWTEELNNQSSEQYKHLTTDVIEKMNKTLRKFSSFNQVLITGLSQGSVVVDSKISFYESNISNNDVIEALKNITFWTIDTNSINVTEYFVSSTTLVPTTSITLPMSTNQTTESTVNVTESARTTTSSLQPLVNVTEIYNLTTVASNISTTMSAINETEAFNITTTVYIMTGMETNTTATLNMTYSVTNATEAYYTTTPLPTNMTYSTTSIYSTTEMKLKMFSVSFKIISLNWTEELNNQSSEQYKHLTTDVIEKMNKTLRKFSSFNQVLITGLSQGSVVVDSKISFYESNISNNDVIEALKNITFWTIDTNSINVTEYFVSSTTLVPTTSITLPMSTNQTTESTVNVTESARTTTSSLQPLVNVTEIYNLTTVASNISTTMSAINETEAFNMTTTVYIMTGMETNTTATLNMTYSVTNATEAYYTTTPLPTNMTYSTTSIYSTTELKLKMFSVSFKIISLNWTEELNNQSSEQYKHLTTDVIGKMNETLRKFSSFNQVLITGLSQGSVVVDSKISFYESNISNNDVIEALKNITFWTIDTNSINVTEYFVSSTTLVPTTSITLPMSTNQTTESTVNVTESARTTTSSLQPLVNVTEIYNLTTVASNISTTMSAINETEAFNMTTTVYIMTGMETNTTATLNMTYSVTNATEAYYTTTPLPTNMTYSTTSIYSTTEMKLKMFSVSFKIISLNWTEELNNQSSEQYKHLTTDVIEKMNKTLRKFSSFNQVLITGLSQGSVVVDSKISFYESNISNNDVIEALKNITFWTIDTNSINVTEYFVSSTTLVPTTSITLPMSTNQTTESTVNVTESARTTTSSLQPLVNVTEIYNLTTVASNISTTMSAINETEAFNMTTTVYIMTGMETNTTATLNMTYSVTNATEAYYTTTPLPTNMTYSTTSIYSTTEMKLKMFSVSFKIISLNWTEELNNQSSEQYKHLTTDVIEKMNETLRKFSSFNQVLITGLSQGSVVVDSKISFYESNISNNDVIEALKNITFWTIDTNSINVTEYFVSSTTLVPTTSITLPMSTNQTTESTVNVTESARTTTSSLQPLVNVTEIYNLTTVASNISTTMSAINETEAFNMTTTVYIMTGMETNTTATLNMTYSVTNATEAYYTTTPLPTNMTYSTTSIYSTTEMKLKMFSVSFKIISLNWTEELNNQSSEQYKHLTTDVIEKMNETLRKFSSFNQVLITGLSQGSVVVDSKISFYESNISNNDVIEALKNITFWTIDTNSINVTEYFVSSTTLVPTTSITLPMSTNQTTESTVNVTESARTTTSSLQPLVNVTEIYNLTTVASNISTTMSAINETEAFNMTTTVYIMTGMETNTTATLNMTYSVTNATEAYYTTTPLPTNMTYSTTSIYSTTEMKLKMFSVSFKIISLNWTEELNNQSSEQYKHLTTDVIEKMNETLRKFSSFNQVLITGLSQGSVVVDSKISFYESNISNNDVIEALKNITFWTIDTNSINVTEYFVSSTTLVPTTSITLPMSTNQTTESTVNVTESARTTTSSLQPLVNVTEIYNLTTVASNISTTMSAINETEAFNMTTTVYIMTGMETNTTATLNMTYSVTNATEAYYTTTPLPTNMTYSTTSIYSTTEMKLKMFSVSFKIISLNWTEELNNQSSEQYKHLTTDVIEKMNETLRKFSSFNQVLITGLSQGSVVVDSKISFYESNISNNDVIEALKNITFWTIDTNSINVTEYFVSSTTLVPTTSITLPMSTNQTTESTVNVTESARTTTSSLQPLVNVTEIYNLTTVASNISTTMSAINETEAFNITTTVYIMTGMERNTTATLNMTYSVTNATEAYYTTTPLPTNMTYSTTSIYSTTEMKLKMFSVSFKIISLNWTEELNNQSSEQYKHLTTDVIEKMNKTLRKFSSFNQVLITGLSQGSVVVDSKISFYESNISNNDVIEALKNITFWTIDTNSINVTEYFVSSTTLVPTTSITLPMSTNQTTESTVNVTESARTTTSSLQPLVNVTEIFNQSITSDFSTVPSTLNVSSLNVTDTVSVTMTVSNTTFTDYTQSHLTDNLTEPIKNTTDIFVSTQPTTKLTTIPLTPAVVIQGKFTITNGTEWSDQLADMESIEAKALAADIERQLTDLFKQVHGFRDVKVKSFSKGSIIVETLTTFESMDITAENLTDLMKKHLSKNDSKLGIYAINLESVEHDEIKARPTDSDKFPDWAIAVIVCGGCLILFVILMTVILCCRRLNNRKYNFDEEYMQYRRSWASQDTSSPSQTDDIYDNAGVEHYKQPYKIQEGGNIALSETNQRKQDHEHSRQNNKTGEINYGYNEPISNTHVSKNGNTVHNGINGQGEHMGTMVYREDDTITYHDLQKDAWETRL